MKDKFTCYAVLWKYGDGSASGIVSVFDDHASAAELLQFLDEHGDQSKTTWVAETTLHFDMERPE